MELKLIPEDEAFKIQIVKSNLNEAKLVRNKTCNYEAYLDLLLFDVNQSLKSFNLIADSTHLNFSELSLKDLLQFLNS